MDTSEYLLLEDIRGGDARKYAVLVNRYKDRGLALAERIIRSREEAEEVLQDAFVRAFRNLKSFRGDSSFGTWFYRILYNLCLTHTRRATAGRKESLDDDSIADVVEGFTAADALVALEANDIREILLTEVNRLPESYRIPLTLFYMQELSYEEIALVMHLPIGTIKTNLHRARLRLRKNVIADLAEEGIR